MSEVIIEQDGHVGILTLNRPEARNAYTELMVKEVVDALDEFEVSDDVHVVLIHGNGKSFCAGGDVKALHEKSGMFEGDPAKLRERYRLGIQRMMRRFDAFEKPIVGSIHGAAIGAGLGMTCCCDIRVVEEGTKFGATFAKLGLIPGDGSAYLLGRAIGYSRAMELILTARVFESDEAQRIGLAHHVVPVGQGLDRTKEVAAQIASLPPRAVQLAKTSLVRSWHDDLTTAVQLAGAFQALAQHTEAHETAVAELWQKMEKK